MKLEMNKNSLFAVLLRQPWWVSALVAGGIVAAARFVLPTAYAVFMGFPFAVITVIAAWKQLRAPSEEKVAAALARLSALPKDEVVAVLEAGWKREGYEVGRPRRAAFDLELKRAGRTSFVVCRRLKAKSTGVEPLKELHAAGEEADNLIYVAAGEVTALARAFAAENRVTIVEGAELARLAR